MIGTGGPARLALVVLVVVLAACQTVVVTEEEVAPQPPQPPPPVIGPTLVLEVANRSSRVVTIGYDFESDRAAGSGEGSAGACEWSAMPYGEVGGDYRLLVDGVPVHEGNVPRGLPAGAFYVLGIRIGPDGELERVVPPRWTLVAPNPMARPLIGCG